MSDENAVIKSIFQLKRSVKHDLSKGRFKAKQTIRFTVEACSKLLRSGATSYTEEPVYTGSKIFHSDHCPGYTQVTAAAVHELHRLHEIKGEPLSKEHMDSEIFFVEYPTNLKKIGNQHVELVSTKYIAMEQQPGVESVCDFDSEHPRPSLQLVDFIWNCLALKLVTAEDILRFVDQHQQQGQFAVTYLLDREQEERLIESGVHEEFADDALVDTQDVFAKIVTMCRCRVDVMHGDDDGQDDE